MQLNLIPDNLYRIKVFRRTVVAKYEVTSTRKLDGKRRVMYRFDWNGNRQWVPLRRILYQVSNAG